MTPGPAKQFDRDEVLSRALHLFWDKGYEAVGVSELLDHMQIGRQSMYDTFGNKRELFMEALRAYEHQQITTVRGMLSAPGSPMENIGKVFTYWEQLVMEGKGCLIGNSSCEQRHEDEAVSRMLCRGMHDIREAFRDALARASEAGELDAALDPDETADLLVTTGQGVALLSQVPGNMDMVFNGWRGLKRMLGMT